MYRELAWLAPLRITYAIAALYVLHQSDLFYSADALGGTGCEEFDACHHSDSHCDFIENTAHERRYTHVNGCTRDGEMSGAEGGGAEQGTPLLVVNEEMSGCSAE